MNRASQRQKSLICYETLMHFSNLVIIPAIRIELLDEVVGKFGDTSLQNTFKQDDSKCLSLKVGLELGNEFDLGN